MTKEVKRERDETKGVPTLDGRWNPFQVEVTEARKKGSEEKGTESVLLIVGVGSTFG